MKYKITCTALLMSAFLAFPVVVNAAEYSSLTSKEVQIVQQALADSGYYRAGVDGLYGPETVNAIRSFQAAKGLNVTGTLNDATLMALGPRDIGSKQIPDPERVAEFAATERARINAEQAALQDISPAAGTTTILGDDGYIRTVKNPGVKQIRASEVQSIQQSLRDAGYYRAAPVDGIWGPVTTRAVRDFQSDKNLSVTGTPTRETIDALGLQGHEFDKKNDRKM